MCSTEQDRMMASPRDSFGLEMEMKPAQRVAQVTLVAVLVIAAAGIARASIPDRHGVFHGCVNSHTHVLTVRTTSKCPHGTKSISWNERGATGARGKTGAAGRDGVVDAYSVTVSNLATVGTSGVFTPVVTSPKLPAGHYTWTASAALTSNDIANHATIDCDLINPVHDDQGTGAQAVLFGKGTLSYSGAITLTHSRTLSYGCVSDGNGNVTTQAAEATITLVPVHALHS
jgi:hypothetical protein